MNLRTTNDSKLYFYYSIITLSVSFILALIYFYSSMVVEPKVEELLSKEDNINEPFKEAYLILKDPQIFARYERYDQHSQDIEKILQDFDYKIDENEDFVENDSYGLHTLLLRRKLGAQLTRNTFLFFLLLSVLGWIFYLIELRDIKRAAENSAQNS